jgi:FKBP-type peptidyl-prolyl cis-trans isomerase
MIEAERLLPVTAIKTPHIQRREVWGTREWTWRFRAADGTITIMLRLSRILLAGAVLACFGAAMAQTKPATTGTHSTTATKPKTGTTTHPAAKPGAVTLTTDQDKLSYAIGMSIAHSLKAQGVDVKGSIVAQGVKDILSGAKPLLTDEQAQAILGKAREAMMKKAQAEHEAASTDNKKTGEAFLAANKTKEGVVTLPDGLQYKILTPGTGPKPAASDTVEVDYKGSLLDGKEFDSSYKRGQPASFPVGGVIKGWTEALQLMPVGSKWQLFIPPDLAYGDRGAGNGDIPPGSTLVFEVELKSIKEAKK